MFIAKHRLVTTSTARLLIVLTLLPLSCVEAFASAVVGQVTPIEVPDCIESESTAVVSTYSELIAAVTDAGIDVVCMEPGHYPDIRLEPGGRVDAPRYLIPVHSAGTPLVSPWDLPEDQRVIFDDRIEFASEYWNVVGLAVVSDVVRSVDFSDNSYANVMDNVLIEGRSERIDVGSGDRSMVRMSDFSFYNTIQNSIIRNSPRVPYEDSHCLGIRNSSYNTIIDNQFYDCAGDAIQFLWRSDSIEPYDSRGNKIVDNEIYVSPRLYAMCSDPSEDANLNGSGDCACAENGIDIKITSTTPITNLRDKVVIRDNILYGFRKTHQSCGGTGDIGAPAVYLHNRNTSKVRLHNNLIFDADTGIQVFDSGDGGPTGIEVFNNLLYNIRKKGALHIVGGSENLFSHNTIISTLTEESTANSIKITPAATSSTVAGNLAISEHVRYSGYLSADHPDPDSLTLAWNGYLFNATPIRNAEELSPVYSPAEPLSNYDPYCVTLERHTGAFLYCIPYVIPRSSAVIVDLIGYSDFSYWFDFLYNTRLPPYDLGAVEYQGL